ncbi:hypothetical protein F444_14793, partial [Phytophthora nicotianae P1976]
GRKTLPTSGPRSKLKHHWRKLWKNLWLLRTLRAKALGVQPESLATSGIARQLTPKKSLKIKDHLQKKKTQETIEPLLAAENESHEHRIGLYQRNP